MVILAFTFGTLVAMGLPIVSAVFGLIVGLSLITLLGHGVTVPTIAPTVATMIGLGVGIDYALFLVTRHRDNRKQGMELHEAVAMAVATSGSAIVFAGSTVVIALLALLVAGIPLVTRARILGGRRSRDCGTRRPHSAAGGARHRRAAHRVGPHARVPAPFDPRISRAVSGAGGRAP